MAPIVGKLVVRGEKGAGDAGVKGETPGDLEASVLRVLPRE